MWGVLWHCGCVLTLCQVFSWVWSKIFTMFSGGPLMFLARLKLFHWLWVVKKVTEDFEAFSGILVFSEAIWVCLMGSEGFLKVLRCSLMFWDVLRSFGLLSLILSCSVRFLLVQKCSMMFWCNDRYSLVFWNIPDKSKVFFIFWGSEAILNARMCS